MFIPENEYFNQGNCSLNEYFYQGSRDKPISFKKKTGFRQGFESNNIHTEHISMMQRIE